MKKDTEIIKGLQSKNETVIIETILKLRNTGHIIYLEDVFKAYSNDFQESTKKVFLEFISDIKTGEATGYIVSFIKNLKNEDDIALFTSCCWQSGLDFHNYIDFFIDLIIGSNYQVSIEVFTVIENCMHNLENDVINRQVIKLKNSIKNVQNKKKPLLVELIKTFQSFQS